jgi:hypothetical protein
VKGEMKHSETPAHYVCLKQHLISIVLLSSYSFALLTTRKPKRQIFIAPSTATLPYFTSILAFLFLSVVLAVALSKSARDLLKFKFNLRVRANARHTKSSIFQKNVNEKCWKMSGEMESLSDWAGEQARSFLFESIRLGDLLRAGGF